MIYKTIQKFLSIKALVTITERINCEQEESFNGSLKLHESYRSQPPFAIKEMPLRYLLIADFFASSLESSKNAKGVMPSRSGGNFCFFSCQTQFATHKHTEFSLS